jgi:porphobilinogen synthase
MTYPTTRMRRLRQNATFRDMVRETHLSVDHLVQPLFACPGSGVDRPVASMPGCSQMSRDRLVEECRELWDLGLRSVLLFGIPEKKDPEGASAVDPHGVVPEAVRALKAALPEMLVWCDICLCEYTDHGHCGILQNGRVDNDATLPQLAKMAVVCAHAGADVVAPSDMMDGRVGALRRTLDEGGYTDTVLVSYAAKYASAFYGPFREAAECAPRFGDRKSYQMDPGNGDEALREVALDLAEGADMVMVKPALAYLDIIHRIKETFRVPVAAYNVSGEYSMIKAAAAQGWVDGERLALEVLLSMRRAGADVILTYHAKEIARHLAAEGKGRWI